MDCLIDLFSAPIYALQNKNPAAHKLTFSCHNTADGQWSQSPTVFFKVTGLAWLF